MRRKQFSTLPSPDSVSPCLRGSDHARTGWKPVLRGVLNRRRGSILLIVLVIVVMLTLGAYTFTETSLSEMHAATTYGRDVEARAFADSGVELAAAILGASDDNQILNLYHNPEIFQNVQMGEKDGLTGGFSLVAPVESDPTGTRVRFGLIDESGRLNLNALVNLELEDEVALDVLMALPEMTIETADSILDWIDEDSDVRQNGAENDYYQSLAPPYLAANGPLTSLDELLKVQGVTPWLLFGEDANRNGLLDAGENDGEFSPPFDNADGYLNLGWSAYLTVFSRESNLRDDGSPKIELNQSGLAELYDELVEETTEEVALFIVAYRAYGPVDDGTLRSDDFKEGGGGSNATEDEQRQMAEMTAQLAAALFGGGGEGALPTRGGLKAPLQSVETIGSLYDMVDTQVTAEMEDGTTQTLDSPFTSDNVQQTLGDLWAIAALGSEDFIEGRVNVNQARRETIAHLPGMTDQLADSIVGSSLIGSDGQPATQAIESRQTTAWMLAEGIADVEQMRQLDQFLTGAGDVFRVQVVGYYDGGGGASRVEAVIDASGQVPKVVYVRDLTHLGRGYTARHLVPQP